MVIQITDQETHIIPFRIKDASEVPEAESFDNEITGRLTSVLGTSGSGKSVLLKRTAVRRARKGVPVYCIAPPDEYEHLTFSLDGVMLGQGNDKELDFSLPTLNGKEPLVTTLEADSLFSSLHQTRRVLRFLGLISDLASVDTRQRLLVIEEPYDIFDRDSDRMKALDMLMSLPDKGTTVITATEDVERSMGGHDQFQVALRNAADLTVFLRQDIYSISYIAQWCRTMSSLMDYSLEHDLLHWQVGAGLLVGPDSPKRFDIEVDDEEKCLIYPPTQTRLSDSL